MQKIMTLALGKLYGLRDKLAENRGQALVEYALIGGMVAVVIVGALAVFFNPIGNALGTIGTCVGSLGQTGCPAP